MNLPKTFKVEKRDAGFDWLSIFEHSKRLMGGRGLDIDQRLGRGRAKVVRDDERGDDDDGNEHDDFLESCKVESRAGEMRRERVS